MRRFSDGIVFIISLCLVWAGASAIPAAAQTPLGGGVNDLRCENATNPRNITALNPQLTWVIGSKAHQGPQRAYQILVASSEEKLDANEGDMWDSGKVMSDQKTARYEGKALSSFRHYYWKIQVWTSFYQASGYSDPASWEMDLLPFDDQKAR